MINSLWYPPNSSTTDVRLWDANGLLTPRATATTTPTRPPSYGLMLAYNQFSGNTSLQGRASAATAERGPADGDPGDRRHGQSRHGGLDHNGGAYQSYYNDRPGDSVSASGNRSRTDAINVATDICALDTDTSWIARFLDHRQAGHDPVHRVRGHLRADGAGSRSGVGLSCCSRSRRSAARFSEFGERSDQRLQMVHRHAGPAADQAAAGLHEILDGTVAVVLVK